MIGTPVWVGTISTPVRTYILQYTNLLRKVAFFCICGSGSNGRTFRDMESLCGVEPIALYEVDFRKAQTKNVATKSQNSQEK